MRLEVTLSYRIDLGTVLYSLKVLVRIDESCIGMRVSQNKILPKVISIEQLQWTFFLSNLTFLRYEI